MRKSRKNRKVKRNVSKHEDDSGDGGSVGAYGGNNFAHADAGELAKTASAREAKPFVAVANSDFYKNGFRNKNNAINKPDTPKTYGFVNSGAGKAFLIFSVLVLLDYFLTIYAIRQHFSEFNPLTVSIYKNFQNPEIVFFFFKAAVISLNGLLVYLLLWLGKSKGIFGKIALAYALLAAIFSFAVVAYDIGIITGVFTLPEFANKFIFGFFRFFGMI